jgi:Domain of unknown function (DUF4262)
MSDHPLGGTDKTRIEQWLEHTIATAGWAVIPSALEAVTNDVPVAYTVGLTERQQPELLIVGIHAAAAISLLNELAKRATTSGPFQHGQRIGNLITHYDAIIVDGPADGLLRPTMALYRYGPGNVRLQQCVWPDPDGRFPWDTGYTVPAAIQPVIGSPGRA